MKANSKLTQEPCCPKPTMLVGAGPLTSAIWKLGNDESGWRYRFNVVRQSSTEWLRHGSLSANGPYSFRQTHSGSGCRNFQ